MWLTLRVMSLCVVHVRTTVASYQSGSGGGGGGGSRQEEGKRCSCGWLYA
jgi:hypothetical protein